LYDKATQLAPSIKEEIPERQEVPDVVAKIPDGLPAWSTVVNHIKSAPSLLPSTTLLIGCIALWQSTTPGGSRSVATFMLSVLLVLSALQVYNRQFSSSPTGQYAKSSQDGLNTIDHVHADEDSIADEHSVVSEYDEFELPENKDINRFSWQLLKDGKPSGAEFETVYLDSPATSPDESSIFGLDAQVFVLPALLDDKRLICLIVQMTGGDYGVRYKRVGLTKIQRIFGEHVDEIMDIVTPPGNNEVELGKYYWGPQGKMSGESTICII